MTSTAAVTAPHYSRPTQPSALVVDDDPLFRTLLVGMLKHDYRVVTACDGQEGFYKALECPPDVAVVDVQMPNWDGLKLLSSLRAHDSLRHVAVVMLTSDASRETVLAAIRAGADDYLIKTTLSRGELLQKLARVRQPRGVHTSVASEPCESAVCAEMSKRTQKMIDAWE